MCNNHFELALTLVEALKVEHSEQVQEFYKNVLHHLDTMLEIDLSILNDSLVGLNFHSSKVQRKYLKLKKEAPRRITENFRKYKMVLSSKLK